MKNVPSMIATYRPKKQDVWRRLGPAGINVTALTLAPGQGCFGKSSAGFWEKKL